MRCDTGKSVTFPRVQEEGLGAWLGRLMGAHACRKKSRSLIRGIGALLASEGWRVLVVLFSSSKFIAHVERPFSAANRCTLADLF